MQIILICLAEINEINSERVGLFTNTQYPTEPKTLPFGGDRVFFTFLKLGDISVHTSLHVLQVNKMTVFVFHVVIVEVMYDYNTL
jgi:hypothetical protein